MSMFVHTVCVLSGWLIGKDSDAGRDWGQGEKGRTEDEMAGWHHWLDGRESEWTPGVGDGQGGLACCDSWGRKESDTTERLIWSDLTGFSRMRLQIDLLWFSLCLFSLVLILLLGSLGLHFVSIMEKFQPVLKYFFFCGLQIYTYILGDLNLSHKPTNVPSHLCFGLFFFFSMLCEQDNKKYIGNFWGRGKMIMDSRIVGEGVLIMTIKLHASCMPSLNWSMRTKWKRGGKPEGGRQSTKQDDLTVSQSLQGWINVRCYGRDRAKGPWK